jgi:hypothetical protein
MSLCCVLFTLLTDIVAQINATSGTISTKRLLEMSTVGMQSLKITATDSGRPAKTATCKLYIFLRYACIDTNAVVFQFVFFF